MFLNAGQQMRYNRQIILEGFGEEGQQRLLQSKVLLVGVGGLGSPIALYLAAAGVGQLGIVDGDNVDVSNLQRQIIHSTPKAGRLKVDSAEERINALNPDVKVVKYPFFLHEEQLLSIIDEYDFVVDGSDNFTTKYLINDACVKRGKPCSIGGINRYTGQLMTYVPGSACYRCLFPQPPVTEKAQPSMPSGVLGSIAGVIGTMQATECLKYLTGVGQLLTNTLLLFDALTMEWQRIHFEHNDNCLFNHEKHVF